MQTPDLTEGNITKIKELFPNVITEKEGTDGVVEKAVDFELLKQMLSKELVEDDNERYRLDWPGKKASLLKANTPITSTLRPDRKSSVDFDTTENVFIEGDNFEVLKVLQESYLGKIKMIYIDPPYNTGKDFVYRDNRTVSKEDYGEELGVEDEEGGKLFRNTDTNGRFHSDWLSMMNERLIVARDLLKDDGVIFISIDDNEVNNLRKVCDEIFGENNIEMMIWKKVENDSGKLKITYRFRTEHEYIIVGYKDKKKSFFHKFLAERNYKNTYNNPDNDPRGEYKQGIISTTEEKSVIEGKNYYKVTTPSGKEFTRQWRCDEEEFNRLVNDNRIYFGKKGDSVPSLKVFINEMGENTPVSVLEGYGTAKTAGLDLIELFKSENKLFDYPKPVPLIRHLIQISSEIDSIILDFFAGSSATAQAVMDLNAEDMGDRKFIMVQIPEETDKDSEAYKAGYKYISDIAMERIRLAGKKILKENAEKLKERETPLDIGFRVYKTDTTNMKDVYYHPSTIDQNDLFNQVSNIKDDRTPEDLLTQVILDLGLTLDLPIEKKKIKGNDVYFVSNNALVACFDDKIDFGIIDEIAKLEPLKVVFKDGSFKEEQDRTNVDTRFKRLSPDTIITVL